MACPSCASIGIQPALLTAGTWECIDCKAVFQPKRDREPLDNDPPRCSQCGRLPPTHAKDCPKVAAGSITAIKLEMHGAEGEAMICIFNAITEGATLILTGPNSVISPSDNKFGATLEDATGEIDANAYGTSLGDVLIGLVTEWRSKKQLAQHQAQHDSGVS